MKTKVLFFKIIIKRDSSLSAWCRVLFVIISIAKNFQSTQVGQNQFNVWIMGLSYTGQMRFFLPIAVKFLLLPWFMESDEPSSSFTALLKC